MSEAAAPLTDHGLVLADKYRNGQQNRELVLDVDPKAAVRTLLASDLYQSHTRYSSHVSVMVLAPAGHLSVGIYPHDGQLEWTVEEFFASAGDPASEAEDERAGLSVESACTDERADAVLNRVIVTIANDHPDHQI